MPWVAERLVIQYRSGVSTSDAVRSVEEKGARVEKQIERLNVLVLRVPEQAAERVKRNLEQTGRFNFVERDFLARGSAVSNDPSATSQWHLAGISANAAWDIAKGSVSVPIAVVDSGVDGSHPDLASKMLPGWNFLGSNTDTHDVLGHGTAVAGSAAASTDNGIGVAGVGWNTPIMPLVVLNSSNYASYSNVANAIVYAADHGIRIINVSICGTSSSSTLQSAVDYAWKKGAVVFAAAGNNGNTTPMYPAACQKVVAVAATDPSGSRSSFSNYGSWISLAAPGSSILTTSRGGSYSNWAGTSFASPITAGVAALMLAIRPGMTATDLVNLLLQNTDDAGTAGFDSTYGNGRLNAYKAVFATSSISSDTTPPAVTISSPASDATVTGTIAVQGTAADTSGIKKTELYVDGGLVTSGLSAAFSLSWNTSSSTDGTHQVMVKAYDTNGNVGQSTESVVVSNPVVVDTQAPVVSFLSPAANAKVSAKTRISLSAADNIAVTQVNLYIDGTLVYTAAAAPYTWDWNARKAANGSHVLSARAWDKAGNMGTASITVQK